MDGLAGMVATAAGMFAGTNVDDIVILTVLFLASRTGGSPRRWQIWAGQYAGVAILVLVSALAALGLQIIPDDWVGLLGLVPIVLGVKEGIEVIRGDDDQDASPAAASGLVAVVTVTIANGGDNIAVYTPTFRTIGAGPTVVIAVVFTIGVALWCVAGSWLGSHHRVVEIVEPYGQWLVPAVFIVIGAVIVIQSGVLGKIF